MTNILISILITFVLFTITLFTEKVWLLILSFITLIPVLYFIINWMIYSNIDWTYMVNKFIGDIIGFIIFLIIGGIGITSFLIFIYIKETKR